ncbi:MAG TPA: MarR family transcriptional regulator [Candidatus Krumholzibacteria bacterium]|nr:MarR family transcriptional regulator [Candidatus Krumholzibacteria bacterium]
MQNLDRATLARRALLDTLRVANLLDRRGGALARQADITSAQWLTLGLLSQVGERGLTPTELCRQLCVSKQNMTGMILRLEKKGLVTRQPEPQDRRSFRVMATPEGHRTVQQLEPEGREFFERQVETLDDERLMNLTESLSVVLETLRAEEQRMTSRRRRAAEA